MSIVQREKEHFRSMDSLWESLGLSAASHRVISITGAGGKTSVMFRLAGELEEMGKRVIVTTSTHIFYPEGYQVALSKEASLLKTVEWNGRLLVVGGQMKEVAMPGISGVRKKIKGMEPLQLAGLKPLCDVLLIEADGSRRLPLKAPDSREPVIIPETDVVIGCAGLSCIGKTWEEGCFRPELARKVLRDRGIAPKEVIRPVDVAHILISPEGTKKGACDRPYRMVLNQADEDWMLQAAGEIEEEIRRTEASPVVITSQLMQ